MAPVVRPGLCVASTSSSMTSVSVSCPLRFSSQARRNLQRQRHVYLPFSSRSSIRRLRHINLVSATSSSSGGPEDPSEGLSGILKSIRANLPVVGLVSALTAPEGGVLGEIGYSEYSRTLYSNAPPGFGGACASLSERYGKGANFRNLVFCCWVAESGAGYTEIVSEVEKGARRVSISLDLEYEILNFEQERDEALKARRGERPRASQTEKAQVAATLLSLLCTTQEVPSDEDTRLDILDLVRGAFVGLDESAFDDAWFEEDAEEEEEEEEEATLSPTPTPTPTPPSPSPPPTPETTT